MWRSLNEAYCVAKCLARKRFSMSNDVRALLLLSPGNGTSKTRLHLFHLKFPAARFVKFTDDVLEVTQKVTVTGPETRFVGAPMGPATQLPATATCNEPRTGSGSHLLQRTERCIRLLWDPSSPLAQTQDQASSPRACFLLDKMVCGGGRFTVPICPSGFYFLSLFLLRGQISYH